MISCEKIHKVFEKNNIGYFTGVPDSILKEWISYIVDNEDKLVHRIAANEGAAIGHAAGYYLSTGKIGVVYMQNAGLGNAVNPLTSLTDNDVFGIPMLLIIGWRGEPGKKDAPQHAKMGKVMLPLLDTLGISYEILNAKNINDQIKSAKEKAERENIPVALIVKRDFFSEYIEKKNRQKTLELSREEAIYTIVDTFNGDEIVVATTGKISRELFECRQARGQKHNGDFYVVGSMGHASAIAMEIACQRPEKKVYLFDGDGALIMHAGTMATIGYYAPENLFHIVFDNCCHESTGGQPTVSDKIDIATIARGCNYKNANICFRKEDIIRKVRGFKKGPVALIIKVKKGSRVDLGRPKISPRDNKKEFMNP
ncbi:MAG: phosphonopyruvate decarboxylase [Candidatus Omnitrophica bacterium]|nr:phosphonopyruvate decarboxylase [Candidatus Omnitrophota bacterium]